MRSPGSRSLESRRKTEGVLEGSERRKQGP